MGIDIRILNTFMMSLLYVRSLEPRTGHMSFDGYGYIELMRLMFEMVERSLLRSGLSQNGMNRFPMARHK